MAMADFKIMVKLGDGAYSSVYKVKRISDGQEYALKKVRMIRLSVKEKENALNEVRILASFQHPNLIAYKEAFFEDSTSSLCIIMEYADGGDLYNKIVEHQKKNTHFSEKELWNIFIQTVKGLKALHEHKILHRDLKSANVFLTLDGKAKLGDFNVSKIAKKGLLYTQTGTPYYASPEVWKDNPYDIKSDIWSMGCVLYEAAALKPPFTATSMQALYKRVLKGIYPNIPNYYSNELSSVIQNLLQVSASLRPHCDKILKMNSVKKRLADCTDHENEHLIDLYGEEALLGTIHIPKNLNVLSHRLPKPNYRRTEKESSGLPDVFRNKSANLDLKKKSGVTELSNEKAESKRIISTQGINIENPLKKEPNKPNYHPPSVIIKYQQREVDKVDQQKEDQNQQAQIMSQKDSMSEPNNLNMLYLQNKLQNNQSIANDLKLPKIYHRINAVNSREQKNNLQYNQSPNRMVKAKSKDAVSDVRNRAEGGSYNYFEKLDSGKEYEKIISKNRESPSQSINQNYYYEKLNLGYDLSNQSPIISKSNKYSQQLNSLPQKKAPSIFNNKYENSILQDSTPHKMKKNQSKPKLQSYKNQAQQRTDKSISPMKKNLYSDFNYNSHQLHNIQPLNSYDKYLHERHNALNREREQNKNKYPYPNRKVPQQSVSLSPYSHNNNNAQGNNYNSHSNVNLNANLNANLNVNIVTEAKQSYDKLYGKKNLKVRENYEKVDPNQHGFELPVGYYNKGKVSVKNHVNQPVTQQIQSLQNQHYKQNKSHDININSSALHQLYERPLAERNVPRNYQPSYQKPSNAYAKPSWWG